jgi:hypothetical protein
MGKSPSVIAESVAEARPFEQSRKPPRARGTFEEEVKALTYVSGAREEISDGTEGRPRLIRQRLIEY